jgi:hypothetical protein
MSSCQERAPDAIEPITAYRLWLADRAGNLSSLGSRSAWPPETWIQAECLFKPHDAPVAGCSCGIYAKKDLEGVVALSIRLFPWMWSSANRGAVRAPTPTTLLRKRVGILGKVELAGKVIEHDGGYRAERARIAEIVALPGFALWTEAVSKRYGVPVGDPIPPGTLQSAWSICTCGRCAAILPHRHHAPIEQEPSPGLSAGWLAASVFFLLNAIHGILMNQGPHWSEWWLWLIALGAVAVAARSLSVLCRSVMDFRIWEPRGSPESAGDRPRLPSGRPRPF